MIVKIFSVFYSVFLFSILFFVTHSSVFGQIGSWDYDNIVQNHKSIYISTPNSELEYKKENNFLNEETNKANNALMQKHLLKTKYLERAELDCNHETSRINKNKCIEAINTEIQQDAGEFIEAQEKVNKSFDEKKRKLNAARQKQTPDKMQSSPNSQYKRIFKDSIIFPQKRRVYERRKI